MKKHTFRHAISAALFSCSILMGAPLHAAVSGNVSLSVPEAGQAAGNVFRVENPDYGTSPYTGMTRQHWMDAARYLLDGAFSYIHSLDDPMYFPQQPGKSYPKNDGQIPVAKLEGLCRTMFMAVPLLKENPDLELNGIKVGEYYRHQLCNMSDPKSPGYIRHLNGGPSQTLVEFGGLAVSLTVMPEILWDPLPQAEKDKLAALMISYGNGPTIGSNWRFFNIFVLSFFKERGYAVREGYTDKLLKEALDQYKGYGWYNDSPAYDYYSMWAFQMYGMIWSHYYADKFNPEAGRAFRAHFKDLVSTYPYMWSEQGQMNMYGRSICYRTAAAVPFPLMGWIDDASIDYGWMRRIASSTLLQFLTNPAVMEDRIPTLGFYGAFEPAVQIYSCRGSVFWMGKIFLGLLVPESNPFWTATETEGAWKEMKKQKDPHNLFMPGSNTMFTNYPNSGASEVRAWCHEKVSSDWQKFRSGENYNKLAYNTEFPWMADGKNGEVSMNYAVKNKKNEWEVLRLYTFRGFENGIYRRDAVLETDDQVRFRLADIPLPNGILRVDKAMVPAETELRLGHYSLPELDGKPCVEKEVKVGGREATVISNGEYQLAMISLQGWDDVDTETSTGLHPVSDRCSYIVAEDDPDAIELADGGKLYVTLMLWKKGAKPFTKKELSPVKKVQVSPTGNVVEITLSSGEKKYVSL